MAIKLEQSILAGLTQAIAQPQGMAVHAAGTTPGLFKTGSQGRLAAKQCMERGYLESLRTETRGKTTIEFARLSEAGLEYVLRALNPRDVLERLAETAERMEKEFATCQEGLRNLHAHAARVLTRIEEGQRPTATPLHLQNGVAKVADTLLELLRAWNHRNAPGDCPLGQLRAQMKIQHATATVGEFHDALRSLHRDGKVLLHPWTGPLHELPEPSDALLVGHAVIYYASLPAT